jgi:hypothetical protein
MVNYNFSNTKASMKKNFSGIKTSLIMLILMTICNINVHAQSYGNALGVRVANGYYYRTMGLTFQQRLLKNTTLEGIAQTDFTHNTTFHAMVEYHQPIISKRLNYYMGAGLMTGKEADVVKDKIANAVTTTYGHTVFGADLVAGIEITLLKFNVSLDYKPNFNITGRQNWYQGQVGVSARAVILSGAEIDRKRRAKEREKRQKARKEKWEVSKLKQFFEKDIFH